MRRNELSNHSINASYGRSVAASGVAEIVAVDGRCARLRKAYSPVVTAFPSKANRDRPAR